MADVKDDKYIRAYDKQLRIGEKKEIGAIRSYYKQEYNKGVDQFLKTSKTSGFNELFSKNKFDELYESIYVNIGLRFASWYANNIDKYIVKQLETNKYRDTWETTFAKEGKRVAAVRVVTVQGTAKKELEKTLQRLMTDADFQSRGAAEKGRILRQRFNKLGTYQAERIVRTEATNAANLGVMQSATDVYGKNSLQKKWITSMDGRERSAHAAANGQIVDFNDKFKVGGELLDRAGDPAGSAANVVNCRCAIAPFPKAEAQAITPLTGFDFGLSAGRTIGLESANAVDDILKPKPQPTLQLAPETTTTQAKTVKEFKEIFIDKFKKQEVNVTRVSVGRGIDIKDLNKMIDKFTDLSKKYKISELRKNSDIVLKFTGGNGYAGRVRYHTAGRQFDSQGNIIGMGRYGKAIEVDFGRGYNSRPEYRRNMIARHRSIDGDNTKISKRGKSISDKENWEVTTLSHEYAHYIDVWETSTLKDTFWKEMQLIQKQYNDELRKYAMEKNAKKYNEIFLGNYASSSRDEFFAEAFAEFETRKNSSKFAKLVGELTIKYFGK